MSPFRMELQIIKMPKNVEKKNIKGANSRILKTDVIKEKGIINTGYFKFSLS